VERNVEKIRTPFVIPGCFQTLRALVSRPGLRLSVGVRQAPLVGLGLATGLACASLPAVAQTPLEQAMRSGQLVMVGAPDSPPFLSLNAKGEPEGYAIDLGRLIDAELQKVTGKKVQLRFQSVPNNAAAVNAVSQGQAALACGIPLSWARDQVVDYSIPIGLSGLRLLAKPGGLDGQVASLAGQKIAVVSGSLAATSLPVLQPQAQGVSFESYGDAVTALQQGGVAGVLGDTVVLSGIRKQRSITNFPMVPEIPLVSYGVGCIMPENSSDLGNIVNISIAKLMQAYLDSKPEVVLLVERWFGPSGVHQVGKDQIRAYFQAVLLTREPMQSAPASP
jgi:polar amino acid transport system substrate-binding protein